MRCFIINYTGMSSINGINRIFNNHVAMLYDIGAAYILSRNYPLAVKKYNLAFSEYSALGCTDELTARKIAAADQMQRYGFDYPKEWETDYLE